MGVFERWVDAWMVPEHDVETAIERLAAALTVPRALNPLVRQVHQNPGRAIAKQQRLYAVCVDKGVADNDRRGAIDRLFPEGLEGHGQVDILVLWEQLPQQPSLEEVAV